MLPGSDWVDDIPQWLNFELEETYYAYAPRKRRIEVVKGDIEVDAGLTYKTGVTFLGVTCNMASRWPLPDWSLIDGFEISYAMYCDFTGWKEAMDKLPGMIEGAARDVNDPTGLLNSALSVISDGLRHLIDLVFILEEIRFEWYIKVPMDGRPFELQTPKLDIIFKGLTLSLPSFNFKWDAAGFFKDLVNDLKDKDVMWWLDVLKLDSVFEWILKAAEAVFEFAKDVYNAVADFTKGYIKGVSRVLGEVWKGTLMGATVVADFATDVGEGMIDAAHLIADVAADFGNAVVEFGEDVGDTFVSVGDEIVDIGKDISSGVKNKFNQAKDGAGDVINSIGSFFGRRRLASQDAERHAGSQDALRGLLKQHAKALRRRHLAEEIVVKQGVAVRTPPGYHVQRQSCGECTAHTLNTTSTLTPAVECVRACDATEKCVGFNYDVVIGVCTLFSSTSCVQKPSLKDYCYSKARNAAPSEWKHCADEEELCKCSGMVRFGLADQWFSAWVNGQKNCSDTIFRDPAPGHNKTCECIPVSKSPLLSIHDGKPVMRNLGFATKLSELVGTVGETFDALDTDGSGTVSREEMTELDRKASLCRTRRIDGTEEGAREPCQGGADLGPNTICFCPRDPKDMTCQEIALSFGLKVAADVKASQLPARVMKQIEAKKCKITGWRLLGAGQCVNYDDSSPEHTKFDVSSKEDCESNANTVVGAKTYTWQANGKVCHVFKELNVKSSNEAGYECYEFRPDNDPGKIMAKFEETVYYDENAEPKVSYPDNILQCSDHNKTLRIRDVSYETPGTAGNIADRGLKFVQYLCHGKVKCNIILLTKAWWSKEADQNKYLLNKDNAKLNDAKNRVIFTDYLNGPKTLKVWYSCVFPSTNPPPSEAFFNGAYQLVKNDTLLEFDELFLYMLAPPLDPETSDDDLDETDIANQKALFNNLKDYLSLASRPLGDICEVKGVPHDTLCQKGLKCLQAGMDGVVAGCFGFYCCSHPDKPVKALKEGAVGCAMNQQAGSGTGTMEKTQEKPLDHLCGDDLVCAKDGQRPDRPFGCKEEYCCTDPSVQENRVVSETGLYQECDENFECGGTPLTCSHDKPKERCSYGATVTLDGRETSAWSQTVANASECQQKCLEEEDCTHFAFHAKELSCEILANTTAKVSASAERGASVSGVVGCLQTYVQEAVSFVVNASVSIIKEPPKEQKLYNDGDAALAEGVKGCEMIQVANQAHRYLNRKEPAFKITLSADSLVQLNFPGRHPHTAQGFDHWPNRQFWTQQKDSEGVKMTGAKVDPTVYTQFVKEGEEVVLYGNHHVEFSNYIIMVCPSPVPRKSVGALHIKSCRDKPCCVDASDDLIALPQYSTACFLHGQPRDDLCRDDMVCALFGDQGNGCVGEYCCDDPPPTEKLIEEDTSMSVGVIVGISVGVFVAVALLVVGVVCLKKPSGGFKPM